MDKLQEYKIKYDMYILKINQILEKIKESIENPNFSSWRKTALLDSNSYQIIEKEKQRLEANHQMVINDPKNNSLIIYDFLRDLISQSETLKLINRYFLGIYE